MTEKRKPNMTSACSGCVKPHGKFYGFKIQKLSIKLSFDIADFDEKLKSLS